MNSIHGKLAQLEISNNLSFVVPGAMHRMGLWLDGDYESVQDELILWTKSNNIFLDNGDGIFESQMKFSVGVDILFQTVNDSLIMMKHLVSRLIIVCRMTKVYC